MLSNVSQSAIAINEVFAGEVYLDFSYTESAALVVFDRLVPMISNYSTDPAFIE